jgi:8-oxo-dGTP pyrophosphatase MutT (NUDIX family)
VRMVEPDGLRSRDGAEPREPCVATIDCEAGTSLCDSPRESGWEFGFEWISPDDSREFTLFSDDLFRRLTASSLILGSCRLGGEGGE